MLGFTYQPLFIIAIIVALPFQRNWRDRRVLITYVVGAIIVVDVLIVLVSYVFVKSKIPSLGLLDFPILWLPLLVPAIAWYYAEKNIKNKYDNN